MGSRVCDCLTYTKTKILRLLKDWGTRAWDFFHCDWEPLHFESMWSYLDSSVSSWGDTELPNHQQLHLIVQICHVTYDSRAWLCFDKNVFQPNWSKTNFSELWMALYVLAHSGWWPFLWLGLVLLYMLVYGGSWWLFVSRDVGYVIYSCCAQSRLASLHSSLIYVAS